jgi:pectate lyase
VNDAIVELDSAPFTVAGNTWYRTRFEAVGTQLRVYINDSLVLEATDASHASGRYGPVMYRAGMEYDDILAVQP